MNRKYTRMIAKILGLLLALMMVVGVCAPVMAAGENKDVTKDAKGSITVTSDESGWTAKAYKVIDVNFDFDKLQPVDPAYTWNDSVAKWLSEKYPNYIGDGNAVTNQFQDLASSVDPQFGQDVRSFVDALAKKVRELTIKEVSTASELNRTAKMDNLEMGGYLVLVESTTGTEIYAPGFVNIYPSFENNKWVLKEDKANANMAIKSSDPTIVKTADKTTVAIGDTVTYTLEMDVPQYPENTDHKTFIFGDKLPSGLQLVSDSLKIFSKDTMADEYNITEQFQQTNPLSQDATFEYKIKNYVDFNKNIPKIYVQYKATVVSPAYDSRDNLKNTAYLLYDKNPYDQKDETTRKTAEVKLYTYGIRLTKTGEKDSPIAGAEFKLKKGDTEVKLAKDEKNGFYYPSVSGTATLESAETTGEILIKGLDVGTYTLEETKAPAGYTLPKNATITVTLKDGDNTSNAVADGALDNNQATKAEGAIVKANSGAIDRTINWQFNFTVTNSKSNFNLPITGGVGTVLFTVAGIMVMAGAVVLMTYAIRRKKRSSMK